MPSLSRYEVLDPIGDNHYARYFKGYDVNGERDVCIIEFHERFRRNAERWDAIWQQVLAAGRVKHDFLVNVYDYDKEHGWVITELMQGSLRELPTSQTQNVELVRTVIYRTLDTLDHLHANQHSHGDVRPGNLLYDVAGQSKLSFSPGIVLGGQIPRREKDHAFLAPELFDGSFGEVGVGVDLYGCGMSALSLLLGDDFARKLLGVAASDDLAWQRFHRDVNAHPSVRALLPALPADMEAVIQKLISKRVTDRFTSIAEARALLVRPQVEVKIQVPDSQTTRSTEAKRPAPIIPNSTDRTVPPRNKPKRPRPIRDWLNQKLKNPLVMGMVSAVIVAMMMFAIAVISVLKEQQKRIPVTIISRPAGATIYVDDKQQDSRTDTQLQLTREKHVVKLELAGYQSLTRQIDIPSEAKQFEFPVIELSPQVVNPKTAPETKPQTTPQPKPIKKWELPHGLAEQGTERDPATGLPLRAIATRLKQQLKSGDLPLEFVLLPPGRFRFGAEEPLEPGELPQQEIEMKSPLYMARHEVTVPQWQAFQGTRKSQPSTGSTADENIPVHVSSAAKAQEFCAWLGPNFALPTEREWEWAARGPENRPFPWGSTSPSPVMVRMKLLSSHGVPSTGAVPVTAYQSGQTPQGVSHLLGNVAEWCRDKYTPGQGESDQTSGVGVYHVIRGGSHRSPASGPVRITWRANAPDRVENLGQVGSDIGIRVVCHPISPTKSP